MEFNKIKIGDAIPISYKLRYADTGAYLTQTGGTVFFTLKNLVSDSDDDALISKTVAGTSTETIIQLTHDDTKDLEEGQAWYDVRFVDSNNNPVTTDRAKIPIISTITQRVV